MLIPFVAYRALQEFKRVMKPNGVLVVSGVVLSCRRCSQKVLPSTPNTNVLLCSSSVGIFACIIVKAIIISQYSRQKICLFDTNKKSQQ